MSQRDHQQAAIFRDSWYAGRTHQQDLQLPPGYGHHLQDICNGNTSIASKANQSRVQQRNGKEDDLGTIYKDIPQTA